MFKSFLNISGILIYTPSDKNCIIFSDKIQYLQGKEGEKGEIVAEIRGTIFMR